MSYRLPDGVPALPGQHFSWREFLSSTAGDRMGIVLAPRYSECMALVDLCRLVLDPLRDHYGKPIRITSGYRSPELNKAIGGSKTSAHIAGRAADLKVGGVPSMEVAGWLHEHIAAVDQAIWYHATRGGHVHIGIAAPGVEPRRQLLYARPGSGYDRIA